MGTVVLSKYQKGFIALIFTVFIAVGFIFADDYGVAWDDHFQIEIAKQNLDFLIGRNNNISNNNGKIFGVAYELPLYIIQNFVTSYNAQVYIRHIITHLYFLVALFIFFKLLLVLFNSYYISILGIFLLYLDPLIFSHSFINTKDIPFLSTFIISIYSMHLYTKNEDNNKTIIFHAFITAFLIDIRLSGFIIPITTFLYILFGVNGIYLNKKVLLRYILYGAFTFFFILILWPALWTNPLLLGYSFLNMAHYHVNIFNTFNGNHVLSTNLPWYYIPTWIGITTPIFIIFFYLYGLFIALQLIIKNSIKQLKSTEKQAIILVIIPISLWILIIILGSTLYDGWRHLFFLSPLLIIGSILGLNSIISSSLFKNIKQTILVIITSLYVIYMGVTILKLHPYENVYFNMFISKKSESIRYNWEMDYWGISFKEGFERILLLDQNDTIKVKVSNIAAYDNWVLTNEKDSRIILVDSLADCDYYITNYRFHRDDYQELHEVFSISRSNSKILSVFKLK